VFTPYQEKVKISGINLYPKTISTLKMNKKADMKSVDYGIDGPVVLLNLIIIGIMAFFLGLSVYYKLLPIRSDIASAIGIFCIIIITFNLLCLLLSVWSSKIGKIKEAKRLLDTYDWKGNEIVLDVG